MKSGQSSGRRTTEHATPITTAGSSTSTPLLDSRRQHVSQNGPFHAALPKPQTSHRPTRTHNECRLTRSSGPERAYPGGAAIRARPRDRPHP